MFLRYLSIFFNTFFLHFLNYHHARFLLKIIDSFILLSFFLISLIFLRERLLLSSLKSFLASSVSVISLFWLVGSILLYCKRKKKNYSSNLSIRRAIIYFVCSFLFILKNKASYNNLEAVYLGVPNKMTI